MEIKEILLKLKESIMAKKTETSRDFEFDAELEDHTIGNQNIYRLYYINYHRMNEYRGRNDNNISVIKWPFRTFMLPDQMTREEAFKVLSYLTDFIEKTKNIKPCSLRSVSVLDNILNIKGLGFKRVNEDDESKIVNLFTVGGRLLLFKKSKLYPKYFEWYTENVTLEEVTNIYSKYNMTFKDIVWHDDEYNKTKILKK